jgi:dipeptidyl-peptidase 4
MIKKVLLILLVLTSGQVFAQKQAFDLNDIFVKGTFRWKGGAAFEAMNNGENYTSLEKDGKAWVIKKYDIKNQSPMGDVLKSTDLSLPVNPSSYEFTDDEKHILLFEATESIYRRSSKSYVYIVNLESKKITKVSEEKVMYPSISPNNNMVAYVLDNNIYITRLDLLNTQAITSDGKKNEIINGAVDWVYEEEFSMSKGLWWNSTGTHLAYYHFDESKVKEFSMDLFTGLYPKQEHWKYPKAGEDNSKVDVYIYNLEKQETLKLNLGSENDQYIPRIKWTNDPNYLSVQRLNRLQNHWELLFCNVQESSPQIILEEQNNTYVEITDNLKFIGKDKFLYTSEKSGFNHLYCYDFKKGKEKALTNGNWEVLSIVAADDKSEIIYYTSTENGPLEDHFYSVSYTGKGKKQMSTETGNHYVNMINGNKYYIDHISSFRNPGDFYLRSTDGKIKILLSDNKEFISTTNKYQFGTTTFGTVKSGNYDLNYWMIKPYNFDSTKKYPVLMHCYGGPGRNTVDNTFGYTNYLWHNYLSSQGYIIISVDNRGTMKRGANFKKSTYKQLGKYEQIDQTAAATAFGELPYVDESRIGIWGWSFGGYLTSLCLTKAPNKFKMGIAVAPVTNWRYYDNIYTERFLQRPQDNPSGYDDNSPINFVKNIKGNYLIVHGTADDNVHFQNSVEMVEAMIQADIKFDSEFYPNKNHGIYGGNTRNHLYQKMTEYLIKNL